MAFITKPLQHELATQQRHSESYQSWTEQSKMSSNIKQRQNTLLLLLLHDNKGEGKKGRKTNADNLDDSIEIALHWQNGY